MGVEGNSKISEYIDYVCSYVKYKGAHKEIKQEISSHIEDIVDEYAEKEILQDESVIKAIERMGDGEVVGKQLNIAHKGTPDWITLILTIVLVNSGIALIHFMQYKNSYISSSHLFKNSVIYTAIGTIGIILLYFFNYKKLEKYSKYIFVGMCLIFILLFINNIINLIDLRADSTVDIKSIGLYVFIIALAGIFNNYDWNKKMNLIKAVGYLMIPMLLMFTKGLDYCGIYFITFMVLALKSDMKKRYAIYIVAINTILFLFYSLSNPYRESRFFSFLHPFTASNGFGYLNVQMYKIAHTSGFFGHGYLANDTQLPLIQSDFVFNYIIRTFGWLGAVVVITIIVSFIFRILHITKCVRDDYGRLLISGLISILIVQFTANILMNVNLFPIVEIELPFISYGGSLGIINMLSVGIIMSVYRRRSLSNS